MTEPLAYSHRPRPFGHDVAFRLEDEALFVDSGRKETWVPYRDIVAVRLLYRPTNVGIGGFHARLRLANGRTLRLSNLSWKSWVDVERRDAAYRAFLGGLVTRAADANPRLLCEAGEPWWRWALVAVTGVAMILGLVAAAILAARRGAWIIAVLALMLLAGFVVQWRDMVSRNRPMVFAADDPPEAVLPAG